MYKNQKRYFSKPIIPPEVIEKSMVKIRTQQKPKKSKIKSKTKVIIKQKTKKQKEIEKEKLLKLYGKNNNLISLLIYLFPTLFSYTDRKAFNFRFLSIMIPALIN